MTLIDPAMENNEHTFSCDSVSVLFLKSCSMAIFYKQCNYCINWSISVSIFESIQLNQTVLYNISTLIGLFIDCTISPNIQHLGSLQRKLVCT